MWILLAVTCVANYAYDASEPDELSIRPGDVVREVERLSGGWWRGELRGRRGMFPDNFVSVNNEHNTTRYLILPIGLWFIVMIVLSLVHIYLNDVSRGLSQKFASKFFETFLIKFIYNIYLCALRLVGATLDTQKMVTIMLQNFLTNIRVRSSVSKGEVLFHS